MMRRSWSVLLNHEAIGSRTERVETRQGHKGKTDGRVVVGGPNDVAVSLEAAAKERRDVHLLGRVRGRRREDGQVATETSRRVNRRTRKSESFSQQDHTGEFEKSCTDVLSPTSEVGSPAGEEDGMVDSISIR